MATWYRTGRSFPAMREKITSATEFGIFAIGMTIETYIPSRALSPFIKAFRIVETTDDLVNRVVPDTSLVMAYGLKARSAVCRMVSKRYFPFMVSGLRKSGRQIDYAKGSGNIS